MPMDAATRRRFRHAQALEQFGPIADAALDALELADLAWHDCCGETALPDKVVDDIFIVAGDDVAKLVRAVLSAVIDFRDLRLNATAENTS